MQQSLQHCSVTESGCAVGEHFTVETDILFKACECKRKKKMTIKKVDYLFILLLMSMSCLMPYLRHREVICERILVKCTATNFAIGICLQPLRPYFILLHYIISGLLNKMGLD